MIKWYKYWRSAKRKNTISLSLLLAHGFIMVSYAFFLHSHILEDGTRVVHAHPFQQEEQEKQQEQEEPKEGSSHEHTTFSYTLLSSLNNLFLNNTPHFSFWTDKHLLTLSHQYFSHPKSFLFHIPSRAPPFRDEES